jgi:hypothetical protein
MLTTTVPRRKLSRIRSYSRQQATRSRSPPRRSPHATKVQDAKLSTVARLLSTGWFALTGNRGVRMGRVLWSAGIVPALCIAGCADSATSPHDVNPTEGVAAASAPVAVPIFEEFVDVNPCSGLNHTVTITGTVWIHENAKVIRFQRTVNTSSGFVGRGTLTFVATGDLEKITLNDMLRHESGAQIRAHFTGLFDISTTPPTVRVARGAVSCVKS